MPLCAVITAGSARAANALGTNEPAAAAPVSPFTTGGESVAKVCETPVPFADDDASATDGIASSAPAEAREFSVLTPLGEFDPLDAADTTFARESAAF